MNSHLNIVLMGSPDFGIPSFRAILNSGHKVKAIVTVPDKPKGRGLSLHQSDVKIFALENNIKVFQPESLKDETFINDLRYLEPDLFIIIAFRILPREVFSIPRFGSINLHGSLLPKYRGAAPINWAIINGEKETGITTFFLSDKVDTGKIILQEKIPINIDDTFGDIYYRLSEMGSDLILKTIDIIVSNNFIPEVQDDTFVTKAPKIYRDDCKINWSLSSLEIHNFIRGLSPHPAAFTSLNNQAIKIYKSAITEIHSNDTSGKIIIDGKKLLVNTKDNFIEILKLQPQGKKVLSSIDFINGIKNLNSSELQFL